MIESCWVATATGAIAGGAFRLIESCWVATATGESECVQCNEARVRGAESRSEEHVGVTGVESVRRAERRL